MRRIFPVARAPGGDRRGRRRAFGLIEAMVAIGLLAVFSLIATQVFRFAMQTSVAAGQSIEASARTDLMLGRLRRDVWEARQVEADGPSVRLVSPDGAQIEWRAASDGSIERLAWPAGERPGTAGDRLRLDFGPPKGAVVRFTADRGNLRVDFPIDGGGTDQVTMTSQLRSAGGKS